MSANKNKIIAQAQKLAAAGKFDKAIAEYEKVVKEDPSDIRTWLKMGDLFTRMGSRSDATATYIKVAEQYNKAGFHLKAVAVYKQILKIDPTLIDVYEMLAEAYLKLGLTSEALIQLEQLTDLYQRTGQLERMLDALIRMAGINPQNISTRLRIAEQHSKDGNTAEAVVQFRIACDQLREQGRVDDFLKVAERLLFHDPDALDIARETAGYYLENRQYKRALAKLQICFSRDNRDIRTLELLAEAFVGLGQPDKSISVYNEIAHVIGDHGDQDQRRRIYERILEIDPENQAALAGLGRAQSVPTRVLGPEGGLPSPAAAPAPAAEPLAVVDNLDELSDEEIASRTRKILNEAEVLLKYGLTDRAVDHLTKIFEFDYYNLDAREKMSELLLAAGRRDEALEHLFALVDGFIEEQPEGAVYYLHRILEADSACARAIETLKMIGGVVPEHLRQAVEAAGAELGGFELEIDETVPDPGRPLDVAPPDPDALDDDLLVGFDDEDDDTAQFDVHDIDRQDLAEIVDDDAEEDEEIFDLRESFVEEPPAPTADEVSGLALGIDLDDIDAIDEIDDVAFDIGADLEELEPEPEPEPAPKPAPKPVPKPEPEPAPKPAPKPVPKPEPVPEPVPAPKPEPVPAPKPEPVPAPKPEPVPAPKPAPVVLPKPAALPRPSLPPREARQPVAPRRSIVPAAVPKPEPEPPLAPPGETDLPDISSEIEEMDFFLSQELLDEAQGILDELLSYHPDDPRLSRFVEALKAPVEKPAPADPASDMILIDDGDDDDDLLDFDQLADDLDQLVDDFADEETTHDQGVIEFEEVFSQFKAGVQAQVSATDFATHYDLGLAYKEMGLFDDAISEFEIASGDLKLQAQVAIMIGLAHLGAGRTDAAIEVLTGGLALADLNTDETLGLKYELAKAHEAAGQPDSALALYNELLNEDPGFADVVERIDVLGG